jgi:serine/threonine-protein kinase
MGSPNPDACRASCRHYDSLRGGPGPGRPPTYGAIAITRDAKHIGVSTQYLSRAEAQEKALDSCRADSGNAGECAIAVWFTNACGALVRGDNGAWGADWASLPRQAIAKATRHCEQHGANCAPVRAFCTN